jgi:type II secretory ATPase GspE/PulE/Tfp pilus assembly ATPase PilB-like protein
VDQCPLHYPVIPRLDELESECGKDRKVIAPTREGSKKGEQREREKQTKSNDNSRMIQETSVLLRVEHLQKGASGIHIHPRAHVQSQS